MQDHRVWKEPSKLFESMVVVGLPPTSDIKALQNLYFARKVESSGRIRSALGSQYQSCVEPNLEPRVLTRLFYCYHVCSETQESYNS